MSEVPHVILNQARVHDVYLKSMRHSATRLAPDYGVRLLDLSVPEDPAEPITVRLQSTDADGEAGIETIKARYVVGCDGARSEVRKAMGRDGRAGLYRLPGYPSEMRDPLSQ